MCVIRIITVFKFSKGFFFFFFKKKIVYCEQTIANFMGSEYILQLSS